MPVQPEIGISIDMVTHKDQVEGTVPDWCELVMDVENSEWTTKSFPLTRAAGEAIIDALHEALHPWAGKPVVVMLEDKLDEVYARLMDNPKSVDKGMARGLAEAIATMRNPYQPDIDMIREQAHARWEAKEEA